MNGAVASTSSTDGQRLSAPPVHSNASRSAPHSRSSSWKKLRRAPSVSGELATNSVSFEDAINAKLLELKLLQAEDCVVVRQFDTSPKVPSVGHAHAAIQSAI